MARTLRDHEEICAERYASIERRLVAVETKIDDLHHLVDSVKDKIIGLAVKSGLAIITSLCLAVWVIKF